MESTKSDVVCPSCKNFLSNPITLSCCVNSICGNCFKLLLYSDDKTGTKILYNCPICKKEGEDSVSAYQNSFFIRFVELAAKDNIGLDQYACERCDIKLKITETYVCQDCGGRVFCNECLEAIHSVGKYKTHEKTLFQNSIFNSTKLNDDISCQTHKNEKAEYICTKDFNLMCNLCLGTHKQICRNGNLFIIRDSLRELLSLLTLRNEKLSHQKVVLQKFHFSLKYAEQELDKSFDKGMTTITDNFKQLREVLDFKEKEIKLKFEQTYSKKKSTIKTDLKLIEQNLSTFQGIFNQINFAIKHYDTYFIEGARYIFSKIDRVLLDSSIKKDVPNSILQYEFQNFEDSKTLLYKLSILDNSVNTTPAAKQTIPTTVTTTPKTTTTQGSRASTPNRVSTNTTPYVYEKSKNTKVGSSNGRKEDVEVHHPTLPSFRDEIGKEEIKTVSTKINFNELSERDNSFNYPKSSTFRAFDIQDASGDDVKENSFASLLIQQNVSTISNNPQNVSSITLNQHNVSTLSTNHNANTSSTSRALNHDKSKSPGPKERMSNNYVLPGRNSTYGSLSNEKNFSSRTTDYKTKSPSRTSRHASTNDFKEPVMSSLDVGHLSEMQKNPLTKRQIIKTGTTSNSILLSWTHSFHHTDLIYYLEYGTGARLQGVEQFRTAYKGAAHTCIISDLNPKTSYRIRVCPVLLKASDEEDDVNGSVKKEVYGEWSDVSTISTKENQSIDIVSLGTHGKMTFKGNEYTIQFDRSGIITASYEYTFGKIYWEVKLLQQSAHQSTDDSSSSIKVGVISKLNKTPLVYGSQINYGLNKNSIKIRCALDMDSRTLTIVTSNLANPEVISNLPEGPLYPAFQNKTNKSSLACIKLSVQFDLPPF